MIKLPDDIAFLRYYNVSSSSLEWAAFMSRIQNKAAASILIEYSIIMKHSYYCYLAEYMGLKYCHGKPEPENVIIKTFSQAFISIKNPKLVFTKEHGKLNFRAYLVPTSHNIELVRSLIKKIPPAFHKRIYITSPETNTNAIINKNRLFLGYWATNWLLRKSPSFSSYNGASRSQITIIVAIFFLFFLCLILEFQLSIIIINFLLGFLFFINFFFRLFLFANIDTSTCKSHEYYIENCLLSKNIINCNDLPYYTVLVALYREANQIKSLIDSLQNLSWPTHRLEIKLVCEQDDHETISAISNLSLPSYIEVIKCPDIGPRTKPKALNFAMPLTKGDFIVLYDAEDRPHPLQLHEAYQKFSKNKSDLACLQAPIVIYNANSNWLTRMFAIEYSMMFDGFIHVFARWRTFMLLGGTSNHFRREALEMVNFWDPFNVTEDADLGIRFNRMGFWCSTIKLPTYEEAPCIFNVWLKQRTRWIKGWMQTWLVHMGNPVKLANDLGIKIFFTFQMVLTLQIFSFLVYLLLPVFLLITATNFLHTVSLSWLSISMIFFNFVNLPCFYILHIACFHKTNKKRYSGNFYWSTFSIPIYWFLISFASWRALLHLFTKPFHWEKTPHIL